jgi:hypothetical protein
LIPAAGFDVDPPEADEIGGQIDSRMGGQLDVQLAKFDAKTPADCCEARHTEFDQCRGLQQVALEVER